MLSPLIKRSYEEHLRNVLKGENIAHKHITWWLFYFPLIEVTKPDKITLLVCLANFLTIWEANHAEV